MHGSEYGTCIPTGIFQTVVSIIVLYNIHFDIKWRKKPVLVYI